MNKLHSIAYSFLLANGFSTEALSTNSNLWQQEEYYPISKWPRSRKCIKVSVTEHLQAKLVHLVLKF